MTEDLERTYGRAVNTLAVAWADEKVRAECAEAQVARLRAAWPAWQDERGWFASICDGANLGCGVGPYRTRDEAVNRAVMEAP